MIVPYLTVFASAGLVWTVTAIGLRNWRKIFLGAGVVVVVLAATARPHDWAPGMLQSRFLVRDLDTYRRLVEQQAPDAARSVSFDQAQEMLHRVKDDYEAARYAECIDPLLEVLESYPDLAFTRYVLARCYFEVYLRDPDKESYMDSADRELEHVLEMEPNAPYAQGLVRALESIRGRQDSVAPPSPGEQGTEQGS
jgi:hypothetical protein